MNLKKVWTHKKYSAIIHPIDYCKGASPVWLVPFYLCNWTLAYSFEIYYNKVHHEKNEVCRTHGGENYEII